MPKCFTAVRNLGKHPIQVVLFKDGQSVDWNCCGEITLRSDLVDLVAQPNLGLSVFPVRVKGIIFVTCNEQYV